VTGRAGFLALTPLAGCAEASPGADATPKQVAQACDDGDPDACLQAARMRNASYRSAILVN
jgi:hypothetical protein